MNELVEKLAVLTQVGECIATYGFQNRHYALLVLSDDPHYVLTGDSEAAFDVANFHGVRQHPCQSEWNPFWVFFALHGHLEAVTKIDMYDLSSDAVKHQVRRVAVA